MSLCVLAKTRGEGEGLGAAGVSLPVSPPPPWPSWCLPQLSNYPHATTMTLIPTRAGDWGHCRSDACLALGEKHSSTAWAVRRNYLSHADSCYISFQRTVCTRWWFTHLFMEGHPEWPPTATSYYARKNENLRGNMKLQSSWHVFQLCCCHQ